jgi:hypothetical protein
MQERLKAFEEFSKFATEMILLMEEDRKKTDEVLRRLTESMAQLGDNDQRREQAMNGLLKAVAVIQADIVRIDETHLRE